MKTKNHGTKYDQFGKTDLLLPRLHRPYASMNWIRFNGSLRASSISAPCRDSPGECLNQKPDEEICQAICEDC